MEALLGLFFGLGVLLLLLLSPILALVALTRSSRLQRELGGLRAQLEGLEKRFSAFRRSAGEAVAEPQVAVRTEVRAPVEPRPVPMAAPPPSVVAPPPPVPPRPAAAPPVEPPKPAPAPPVLPPRPPAPRPSPPPPTSPPFDWESLVGLKGAAWLGGITIVIAGIFLAKMAYEAGYFSPPLRMAALLLFGVGGLVWAELSLRKGYVTTANAVSGAGIAILYIGFYAGHALWHLLPLGATFALMVLVTLVAGLLAIRYDAFFTAVLGLLGGFATPLALATGEDRPIGLFSYILLLNGGLIAVALKKRWHGLVLFGAVLTSLIEILWFGQYMSPAKLVIGLGVFLVFGMLYLFLPEAEDAAGRGTLRDTGTLGVVLPLVFGIALAGRREFAGDWPLLFGYLGLLDAALIAVALFRERVGLLVGGALATALALPMWAAGGLKPESLWGPVLGAITLALLLNAPSRLAAWLGRDLEAQRGSLETAGLLAGVGLGFFAAVLLANGMGEPPWPFLLLVAVLDLLLMERTREGRIQGVALLGALAVALLIQIWFHTATTTDAFVRNLSVPLLHALACSLLAGGRARPAQKDAEDEAGAVVATLMAIAGLFACLATAARGSDPLPLCAALAVGVVLLLVSALRRDWTILVLAALAASALLASAWHVSYFHVADLEVALPLYSAFYLFFLALPFLMPAALAPQWRRRSLPWITSALAGPAFFLILYDAISRAWGKAWIGALPLALGALSVLALFGVSRRFTVPVGDAAAARRRLNQLALFAAVALGFVAVAIPLQLDRQWITLGWALEGAALFWLFGRLPHAGLKSFGTLLFAAVGVRLLLNPEVLRYQEHGWPILNWILYTYGVAALCCFAGAAFLKRAQDQSRLAPAVSTLGLLLVFWLINIEIFDFFTPAGQFVELSLKRQLARDLTLSAAWGLYALSLLILGIARRVPALRQLSLGFLLLTVAKVFLYDLSNLTGLYRILSFFGLGISLIAVSLIYQRFVLARERS